MKRTKSKEGGHKKCTNKVFRFNASTGNFDMNSIIVDLGSFVNTLPKTTWEKMGKPKKVWFPIQLRLENRYKIYPIGRLENVEVNIDGVKSKVDFEVIYIIDDTKPHLVLLGIDWDFYSLVILILKKSKMSSESKDIRVVVPLDPDEGERYVEPVGEDLNHVKLENFYKVKA